VYLQFSGDNTKKYVGHTFILHDESIHIDQQTVTVVALHTAFNNIDDNCIFLIFTTVFVKMYF